MVKPACRLSSQGIRNVPNTEAQNVFPERSEHHTLDGHTTLYWAQALSVHMELFHHDKNYRPPELTVPYQMFVSRARERCKIKALGMHCSSCLLLQYLQQHPRVVVSGWRDVVHMAAKIARCVVAPSSMSNLARKLTRLPHGAGPCSRNVPNTEAQNVFPERSEHTSPGVPGNSGRDTRAFTAT